jgi:triosephosphate isomerase
VNAVPATPDVARLTVGISLKLYFDIARTRAWTEHIVRIAAEFPAVQDGRLSFWIVPSLPAVPLALDLTADGHVAVGAQDLSVYDRGAHTGEVSGADLAELGCALVEIGHAERRHVDHNDVIAQKVAAAVRNRLVPVICIGEPDEAGTDDAVAFCTHQLAAALPTEGSPGRLIVAYEPVWAIGAAAPAPSAHIRTVSAALVAELARHGWSGKVIYGGSAGPGTLTGLVPAVDGLFLGRFAHDPSAVRAILAEASRLLERDGVRDARIPTRAGINA